MSQIKIHSLDESNRIKELVALNLTVHGEDSGFWERMLEQNPSFNDPTYHRFLTVDDKIVSGTSLFEHKIKWYGTEIDAGEIGLVGTLENFRLKGYSHLLMSSWLETMKKQKIPLSFLWGIPDFYEKFYYYYAYPDHGTPYVVMPRSCVQEYKPTMNIRAANVEDIKEIQNLYNSYNADLNGHHIRHEKQWKYYMRLTGGEGKEKQSWWVLDDPSNGYAFVPDLPNKPPVVWEIAAVSEDSLRNLVYRIFGKYPGLEKLYFNHHPEMPVGRWLYHWGAKTRSTEDIWKGTWGGMVRLNEPVTCIKCMEEKFNERIAKSRFFNYTGAIPFKSDLGNVLIDISSGKVEVSKCPGRAKYEIPAEVLTPITTGYRGIERYRENLKDLPDEVYELLKVLFPRDKVYMYGLLYADESFSFSS
jgi:predicted acetyltransferase